MEELKKQFEIEWCKLPFHIADDNSSRDRIFNWFIDESNRLEKLIMPKIAEVTRLVVVDHRGEEPIGRIIDTMPVKIETSLQDDNRTLKIFITKR